MTLREELAEVDAGLVELQAAAMEMAREQRIDPYRMQYPSGMPVLAPLLVARAQVLMALQQLEAGQ